MVTEEQLMMVYQLGYTHGKEFAIAKRKFMEDLIEKNVSDTKKEGDDT